MNRQLGAVVGGVAAFGFVIFVLTVIFGSWYTIDQTQLGALLRNGAFVEVVNPGLHFKLPLVDSVSKVDMQTHTLSWTKMEAYSADQQPANLKVSVTIRIAQDRVSEFYSRFGGIYQAAVDRLIGPNVNKEAKIVFGKYTAARAISDRGPLNSDTAKALTAAISYDPVFLIESVQIEDITFSPEYIKSVEQRMMAEVEVAKFRQQWEREKVQADITVTKATADANAVRQTAQAAADAIKMRGDAEASAIKARAAALGENPRLVELTQAERWNGALPTTMIPGGALPMIGLGR